MSDHVDWLKEVRGEILWDPLTVPNKDRCAVMAVETLESIGDYSRSSPTAPSAGRIYRKALTWDLDNTGRLVFSNWWVFRCEADPADPKGTYHHPFRALVIEELDK